MASQTKSVPAREGIAVPAKTIRIDLKPPADELPRGTIEFCLFAPRNETVELIGSWNDWKPCPCKRSEDGWWRCRSDVPDGKHFYKFRVKSLSYFCAGETVDVFDPYARSVTNDEHESSILIVKEGLRQSVNYQWRHDNVPLAPNENLVIYELHVGDFAGKCECGTFRDTISRLDYLADLGINCIELMPVKEFRGRSWGYSLRSLFSVENTYGTADELAELVDECHARGIRVMIDGVYNHADPESPLTRIDYEYWFYKDNPDPPEMHWGPKFNYFFYDQERDTFPARKYVIDSIQFWVEKFHIDGIRFDATRAIAHFDVMRELADSAYGKVNGIKNFITVAEHIPEDPAITGRQRGAPVDAAWHDRLARHLQAIASCTEQAGNSCNDLEELIKKLNPATNSYEKAIRTVNFIGNHDYKRPMTMIAEDGKIFDEAAFRRMKLTTALLLTAPGIPMIWMGQEIGFPSDKSLDPRPINWELLNNANNQNLHAFHRGLINLRKNTPALQNDSFEVVLTDKERVILAYKRWNDQGNVVLVVANLKDTPAGEVVIEGPSIDPGTWHEFLSDYDVQVSDNRLTDQFGPSEVKIFIRKG